MNINDSVTIIGASVGGPVTVRVIAANDGGTIEFDFKVKVTQ